MPRPSHVEHLGGERYRAHFGEQSIELEATRERSYSGFGNDELHIGSYRIALRRLLYGGNPVGKSDVVLDAPCGGGYGTELLSACCCAVGLDSDLTAVAFTRLRAPLVEIHQATLGTALPWPDGVFSAIVCIEGIEHVEQDTACMREFHRLLRNRGLLFITTPERDRFEGSTRKREPSPFHVREYSQAEFAALIHDAGFEIQAWDRDEWTMAVTAVRRD